MGTNVKLNIPKDVLKTVGIEKVIKMIEREVMIEYSAKKLHGKFRGKNLRKLLELQDFMEIKKNTADFA